MSDKRVCPDGGTCHHECADDAVCFRVTCCEPLSGTRDNDEWRRMPAPTIRFGSWRYLGMDRQR